MIIFIINSSAAYFICELINRLVTIKYLPFAEGHLNSLIFNLSIFCQPTNNMIKPINHCKCYLTCFLS